MAKVSSIFNLRGAIGDIVFFRRNKKTIVRKKAANMSDRLKYDSAYAEARKRTEFNGLANSWATGIYRMAKEYASRTDYRTQHKLIKLLYPNLTKDNQLSVNFDNIRRSLKGFSLNYTHTLPPVNVGRSGAELFINCDNVLQENVLVKLAIGTLPPIQKVKGAWATENDLIEVSLHEHTITPQHYLHRIDIPISLKPDQVVISLIKFTSAEDWQEWVRVV
ncbi:MAG: hypothetical protein H6600_01605 [Flavobacteriales bacterium]|nr:hypothetical protein [Flavobacteriales bacterium]